GRAGAMPHKGGPEVPPPSPRATWRRVASAGGHSYVPGAYALDATVEGFLSPQKTRVRGGSVERFCESHARLPDRGACSGAQRYRPGPPREMKMSGGMPRATRNHNVVGNGVASHRVAPCRAPQGRYALVSSQTVCSHRKGRPTRRSNPLAPSPTTVFRFRH